MTTLVGEVAFVTGAAQGVGEAVARRLVSAGVKKLALADRRGDLLERVSSELGGSGVDVIALAIDLLDVSSVQLAARTAQERFGRVDILVNAAGITDRGGLFDTTPETFDRIFSTNVRGNFFLMQSLAAGMVKRRGGVIINISSMLAHGGPPHLLPYSASKAALNLIARGAAHTMRFDRVRVHAINLGWTVTPAERITQTQVHGFPADWDATAGAQQPFGRLLVPDDPAGLCVFLASTDAEMMTGTAIDLEQWVTGMLN